MNKTTFQLKFEDNGNKKYNVEVICKSAVYARKPKSNRLPGLYNLVLLKNYLKEQNI